MAICKMTAPQTDLLQQIMWKTTFLFQSSFLLHVL